MDDVAGKVRKVITAGKLGFDDPMVKRLFSDMLALEVSNGIKEAVVERYKEDILNAMKEKEVNYHNLADSIKNEDNISFIINKLEENGVCAEQQLKVLWESMKAVVEELGSTPEDRLRAVVYGFIF